MYMGNIFNALDWEALSKTGEVPTEIMLKYPELMNWNHILQNQQVPLEVLEKYAGKLIDWTTIIHNQKLPENFIEKHYTTIMKYIKSDSLAMGQKLSMKFIEKHSNDLLDDYGIGFLTKYQKLSESFIRKHLKRFKNGYIPTLLQYQTLPAKLIDELVGHDIGLLKIATENQKLPEDFIRDRIHAYLNPRDVVIHQVLSENFIRDYKKYFMEPGIIHHLIEYQTLSPEFIMELDLEHKFPCSNPVPIATYQDMPADWLYERKYTIINNASYAKWIKICNRAGIDPDKDE